jgi:hypothetical protein
MASDIPREAIRTLVAQLTGVHVSCVNWQGEPEKALGPIGGKAGKITLNVTARRINGTEEARRTYDEDTQTSRVRYGAHRFLTISIRADNFLGHGEAFDTLERLRLRLYRPASRKALRDVKCSFMDCPSIQALDRVVDNRAVSAASMDLRLQQVVVDAGDDGLGMVEPWIEKVSSEEDPDPPTAPVYGLEFTKTD